MTSRHGVSSETQRRTGHSTGRRSPRTRRGWPSWTACQSSAASRSGVDLRDEVRRGSQTDRIPTVSRRRRRDRGRIGRGRDRPSSLEREGFGPDAHKCVRARCAEAVRHRDVSRGLAVSHTVRVLPRRRRLHSFACLPRQRAIASLSERAGLDVAKDVVGDPYVVAGGHNEVGTVPIGMTSSARASPGHSGRGCSGGLPAERSPNQARGRARRDPYGHDRHGEQRDPPRLRGFCGRGALSAGKSERRPLT